MQNTSTQKNLIQFIYGETDLFDTAIIAAELELDWELREEYDALVEVKKQLNENTLSPSAKSIKAILNYSRKTALEASV